VFLLPMEPNTANREVPSLTKNWRPGPLSDPNAFAWTGIYSGTSQPVPEPVSLKAIRLLQHGLLQDGGSHTGLERLRHEAPRRFRVAGRDIRPGAQLIVQVPNDPTRPPPYVPSQPVIPFVMPLHPTGATFGNGIPVWETSVELEPQVIYLLMLGGPVAPGVQQALAGSLPEPPPKGTFQPLLWNLHMVSVRNEDGGVGSAGWVPLRL
jgi:hypothetical protein